MHFASFVLTFTTLFVTARAGGHGGKLRLISARNEAPVLTCDCPKALSVDRPPSVAFSSHATCNSTSTTLRRPRRELFDLGKDARERRPLWTRTPPHARLRSLFLDTPTAPFGVHCMVFAGKAAGRDCGLDPMQAQHIENSRRYLPICGHGVSVTTGGTPDQGRGSRLCTRPPALAATQSHSRVSSGHGSSRGHGAWSSPSPSPLLGIRLGLDGVNPVHHETIKPPTFLHRQSAYFASGHERSHSWGAANIHPWLSGDAPSPFLTPTSLPLVTPLRLVSANTPQSAPLTTAYFREPPAAQPTPHHAPADPFLPVDLKLPEELAADAPMPIAPRDVLVALHYRCRAEAAWSGMLLVELGGRLEQ
ncbi:hypothetical protein B0H14DRAFT_3442194 [Mycena olivaceomarginata]|nr:hypothetical protein B0H14DRAFT_3442194 [Mycena olivaceomarginata]